jgi:hypothetical protein
MNSDSITFTGRGPVLELADGSTVLVKVSTVETETDCYDHEPDEEMIPYISNFGEGYTIYGEEVDGADAAVTFEED